MKDLFDESKLSQEQRDLLEEIRANFDPQNVDTDRFILYEITNYKEKSGNLQPDDAFWEQYEDFYDLGYDEKIGKLDKVMAGFANVSKSIGQVFKGNQDEPLVGSNMSIQE